MRIVVTGAAGFLGTHVRARLAVAAPTAVDVVPVTRASWSRRRLTEAVTGADAVLHLAGVNRGGDAELEDDNIALADDLVAALRRTAARPVVVVAGSNHADADHPAAETPYGRGKRRSGERLHAWAAELGDPSRATEVRFPGLFGEHGRPDYNSFVATFAHRVARGESPVVTNDRQLPLLPVQDAVDVLLRLARHGPGGLVRPAASTLLISEVARRLQDFHSTYAGSGDVPALADDLDVALFNTLRAAMWPHAYPLRPEPRIDARGTLVETVRVHGGPGQAFVSTTHPGRTRGEHVHFAKFERFQVLAGTGLIRVRRLLTDEVLEFRCTGERPAVIDMPTGWAHSIENVGDDPLVTFFWAGELFDPDRPDTYPVSVLEGPDRPRGTVSTGDCPSEAT